MNERIACVRKHSGLSMELFGTRIGLTKSMVSRMESGKNEPTDRTIQSICREFGVNEEWLRTGEGEMLRQDNASILDRMTAEYKLSGRERAILSAYLKLNSADRAAIMRYVDGIVEELAPLKQDDVAETQVETGEMTDEELHAELDRQLRDEKERQAKSQVLQSSGSVNAKLA